MLDCQSLTVSKIIIPKSSSLIRPCLPARPFFKRHYNARINTMKLLRKLIFWTHLIVGVCIGVVVFIMSATGVLLTYEGQIVEWDESRNSEFQKIDQQPLTIDEILNVVRQMHPDEHHFYVRQVNVKGRATPVWAGPQRYLISSYSGEILQVGQSWLAKSFKWITGLHRWLAVKKEQQGIAKQITAYSNLFFIFLIISGAYLWLPRRSRWAAIKPKLVFRRQFKTRHARNYNWHHVFGFWALVPLLVITVTATIFHFNWANEALYGVFGEEPYKPKEMPDLLELTDGKQSYDALFTVAKQHAVENGAQDWYSMWLELGNEVGLVRFYIDRSIGHQPDLAYSLFLDVDTADVLEVERYSDWTPGGRAWTVSRYLHTGEHFGLIGQTVAGLASLAACFLIYSGFMLSWRRFLSFCARRNKQQ